MIRFRSIRRVTKHTVEGPRSYRGRIPCRLIRGMQSSPAQEFLGEVAAIQDILFHSLMELTIALATVTSFFRGTRLSRSLCLYQGRFLLLRYNSESIGGGEGNEKCVWKWRRHASALMEDPHIQTERAAPSVISVTHFFVHKLARHGDSGRKKMQRLFLDSRVLGHHFAEVG
ncbi:hypothetical protein TNCV_608851 [Trichonephila clavipes]|nr:hypothetical protein TNCV_608851 [Trichonephila clavipes]